MEYTFKYVSFHFRVNKDEICFNVHVTAGMLFSLNY